MKKTEILKKIKLEVLGKDESKQITGGYFGGSACLYPRCRQGVLYPPNGVWSISCGSTLYYDYGMRSLCRP